MKVKFIKRHFSGIEAGTTAVFGEGHAKRLIDAGYCEEVKKGRKPKKDIETPED